jgi:hypothetical protein
MNREAAGVANRLSICGEGIDTPAVYQHKNRMRPTLDAFAQTGRKDWAAPEPVTGAMQSLINSAARVFPCLGKSRRFDSGMRRQ